MRISGVKVGRVKTTEPNEQTGLTDTEIEIDARYAPLPKDTRAILRQKTLLGETYVELSPGAAGVRAGGDEADDRSPTAASCRDGQVAETVELDEILRTLRPRDAPALLASGSTSRAAAVAGPGARRSTTRWRC